LVDACDLYFRPIIVMALTTGMLKREILKLRWDQVDLDHGFIFLKDSKNGESREIPVVPKLKKVLEQLQRHKDCPYVFPNTDTMMPYW